MSPHSLRVRRLLVTLATGVALVGAAYGAALATAPPAKAATCVYYVKVFAYVRSAPSLNAPILKAKSAFDRVTGPCTSRNGFIAVYTSAAASGIGWIDGGKLY